ncbi:MAG: DNA polymerase III subunit beta [Patescibacteria group bacterium]|nr:DNA polymerase III subunit beta [Patescibacteria group bacterium]MDE1940892.1 DNA polymerase III subunit beta [Patescibacteria group bacterium]MDE1967078.1 DNA polymerase III subunit beta [Patescibacteria group bacterium]
MKLEIPFQKLKTAVQMVERIAAKHMTLPVLSCILIELGDSTAVFKATNLDVGIEVSIPVRSTESGTIAVPANILSSFISQVFDQNQIVKMETVSGNLNISAGKTKGTIKTVPPEDFPVIPTITDAEPVEFPTDVFIKGLKSVWYSSSVSSVKPELSSVYIYRDNDMLVFAATDSFRLAEKRLKMPPGAKISETLIPFKNVSDTIRILEGMGSMVKMRTNKNLISFETDGMHFVSRVIDGVFPDYKQIIPKGYSTEAVVLKADLVNALKISNIFSDKFNQVHMTIDPKGKVFQVQTKNSDVGENTTAIDAALSGDKVEINFNYKYIADCFQSIDSDSVSLQLSGLNRPMVIRPVSGDQTFMYLAMPMTR